MLTLHAADLLLPGAGADPVPGGAVAVDDGRIADFGPYERIAAAYPGARARRWPGLLTPGLRQWHGKWLLERCYYPDPREFHLLGERPLTGSELSDLDMDATRWAGSVRRGVQQLLRHGTTTVVGNFSDPVVNVALARSGLVVVPPLGAPGDAPGEPDLDPFHAGHDLAGTAAGPLITGGRADLAVFDVPDEPTLVERGAATCVATVLAGRLVHRRR
ncbi:imidazolonepropionase-like domain-containing protein [Streptomyces sp. SAJ15]|uniref:imidazolonepropionase-like domain-containing protein n=1 Tax=Streptomyces sp. SAJ15 TaxID=2011095 RepID=UPI001185D9FA|nr:hypothetical protein [Streptomyces sp. SAJ15]TVL93558.1 hypothetical protein CD790_00325 [Streptomyces sp. SAJ15]